MLSGPHDPRARLGLRDTWFTFVRVSTSARYPRSARPASWGVRLTPAALAGEFSPAPRRHVLALERRVRGQAGAPFGACTRAQQGATG